MPKKNAPCSLINIEGEPISKSLSRTNTEALLNYQLKPSECNKFSVPFHHNSRHTAIRLTPSVGHLSYFALCQLKGARLHEAGIEDFFVVRGPAANVGAWVVQTEAGSLQGGENRVSQSRMVSFWVVILYLIHPALEKKEKKHVEFQSTFQSRSLTFSSDWGWRLCRLQ